MGPTPKTPLCHACKWEAKLAVGKANNKVLLDGVLVFNGTARPYEVRVDLCEMHFWFYKAFPGARAVLGARAGIEVSRDR